MERHRVILKDSTMREGLDVPEVVLAVPQKKALLEKLAATGVAEAELVAPGHFARDLHALREMGRPKQPITLSGLIYGYGTAWEDQITGAQGLLDRVDILMPLAGQRSPLRAADKSARMKTVLAAALAKLENVGVGFPHATQVSQQSVLDLCLEAVASGACRVTLYDTNGGSDPWSVAGLVQHIRTNTAVEICFHAHNDLGLAAANSLAAVRAGASCLDVTVNGLGDRAGNASLEQIALILQGRGVAHGLRLDLLRELSQLVEDLSGVPVAKLAPVVGDYAFSHKSPSHLEAPELFEPFDPALIGALRSFCRD